MLFCCRYNFGVFEGGERESGKFANSTMPKEEKKSIVHGRAPRKALAVKKASKQGASTTKPQKLRVSRAAALTTALMVSSPQALQTRDMNIQSILRTPRSASPTPPSSPVARSPPYKQEEWRTSHATLAARIDVERAELRALKDRVRQMEEAMDFSKTGTAEDARPSEDARPAPSRLGE